MNLAGDVGGTHARMGLFDGPHCVQRTTLDMAKLQSGEELTAAALEALGCAEVERACLAVAGPVLADEARLTNHGMSFSAAALRDVLGTQEVVLVNDLVAMGTAVAHGLTDDAERFGGKLPAPPDATRCVIAAGTGLGMGIIVGGRCLPSEGGHVRVAPAGAFERELMAYTEATLEEAQGVVAWEHYLSGRGLVNLYQAVCHVWDMPPADLSPQEIAARGLDVTDPTCHTTIETWAGMLGSAAGGLAVATMAVGGVWLAGAVPRALKPMLADRTFRRSFEAAAWAADFLPAVPVHLIEDDDAGLIGAGLIAAELTQPA